MGKNVLELLLKVTGGESVRNQLKRVQDGVTNAYGSMRQVGADFLASKFSPVAIFAGIALAIKKGADLIGEAFALADEWTASMQKLAGTSKITGTALEELQDLSNGARSEFKLGTTTANDLAVAVDNLASKSGGAVDKGKLLASVLDLGAARGLTASKTLESFERVVMGIDAGFDQLIGKNQSVIWQEYADHIGKPVGKLSDMEKELAKVWYIMEAGQKTGGSYAAFLETAAGRAEQAATKSKELKAEIGTMLEPIRNLWTGAKSASVDGLMWIVRAAEQTGTTIVASFAALPSALVKAFGGLLELTASGMGKVASLLGPLGKGMRDSLDDIAKWADGVKDRADASLKLNRDTWKIRLDEIWGVTRAGEARLTAAQEEGNEDRHQLTEEELKARAAAAAEAQKVAAASHKALADLEGEAFKASVALLTEQQREWENIKRTFAEKMEGMTRADYAKAEDLLRQTHDNLLLKWGGFNEKLAARVETTTEVALRPLTTDFPEAVATKVAPAAENARTRFYDLAAAVGSYAGDVAEAANTTLSFTRGLGMTNPELEHMVQNVGQLATGIRGISEAITGPNGLNVAGLLGGIAAGITGLQGIIGSLFGDSPAERARKALLQQNSDRLLALKNQIGDLMRSQTAGGKIAKFQGAEGEIAALGSGSNDTPDRLARAANLMRILSARGLGKSDLDSILGDLNVSLGDWGKNGLSREQAAQLAEALRNWEPGRIEQDFTSQLDAIQRQFSIAGTDDPRAQLQAVLGVLAGPNGSQALASLIGGADLSSAEGVANLRAQLASWVGQARGGGLNPATLGGLNGSQFLAALEAVSGLLGRFGFDAASTSASFSAPAPDLGSVVGTVTDSFTAGSLGVNASGELLLTAIRDNTALSAEELVRIRKLMEANAGPASSVALDEALATTRDLYLTSQGL